jgi:hypothetical protein
LEQNGGEILKKTLSFTLAALTIILVLSVTINIAPAANYTKLGVQVGDYAVYKSSITSSTINKTVMLIYGIVGTTVYLNFTNYLPNGAIASKDQAITDTVGGSFVGWAYITASNLTANDPVYSGAAYKINETKSMTIGGAARTVNHMNFTGFGTYLDDYWDKTLGIMVKLNFFILIGWWNYTLISFTSPGAPIAGISLTTIAAIGEGVVIILLLVYIVVSRRGGRRKK